VSTLLGASPDPFCAMESCWLQHIESAHREIVDRLATRLPMPLRRGRVRPLGLDRYGMQLRVEGDDGDHDVRLPFAKPWTTLTGLSQAIRILMGCRSSTGCVRDDSKTPAAATVSPVTGTPELTDPQRRGLRIEIVVVLAVTFGLSAYAALLQLIEAVLLGLAGQRVALNPRRSPFRSDRPRPESRGRVPVGRMGIPRRIPVVAQWLRPTRDRSGAVSDGSRTYSAASDSRR